MLGISGAFAGFCDFPKSYAVGANATFDLERAYNLTVDGPIADMRGYRGSKSGTWVYVVPTTFLSIFTFFNRGAGCVLSDNIFLHDIESNSSTLRQIFVDSGIPAGVLRRTLGDGLAISPDGSRVFLFGSVTTGVNDTYLGSTPGGNLTSDHIVATFKRTDVNQQQSLELVSLTLVTDSEDFMGLEALSNTHLLSFDASARKFITINAATGEKSERFSLPSSNIVSVTDFTTDRLNNIWLAAQWSTASRASLASLLALPLVVLGALLFI